MQKPKTKSQNVCAKNQSHTKITPMGCAGRKTTAEKTFFCCCGLQNKIFFSLSRSVYVPVVACANRRHCLKSTLIETSSHQLLASLRDVAVEVVERIDPWRGPTRGSTRTTEAPQLRTDRATGARHQRRTARLQVAFGASHPVPIVLPHIVA